MAPGLVPQALGPAQAQGPDYGTQNQARPWALGPERGLGSSDGCRTKGFGAPGTGPAPKPWAGGPGPGPSK